MVQLCRLHRGRVCRVQRPTVPTDLRKQAGAARSPVCGPDNKICGLSQTALCSSTVSLEKHLTLSAPFSEHRGSLKKNIFQKNNFKGRFNPGKMILFN